MSYLFLGFAIVFELCATTLLEYSKGFSKPLFSIGSLCLICLSYFCLSKALTKINLGAAYASWSAIGIVVTTTISLLCLHQQIKPAGLLGLLLIMAGCILVNLYSSI